MIKNKPKLIIRNLCKTYKNQKGNKIPVLNNIDLQVNQGELVALVGLSGCGKTTILNCIAGLTNYDSGDIFVDNNKVSLAKHYVSYLMQDDGLLPWYRVFDNVILPLKISGANKKSANQLTQSLLK